MAQDVVDVISKVLVSTVEKAIANAKFDKSMLGVVTDVNGSTYTISAFGGQYNITSDQTYTIGQSIVVTALQGDMKRLVCSPGNIGTVPTINNSVRKINDRLNTFIDEDFADTIIRLDEIRDQLDGSFVSWFYDGAPTADNEPAKNWTTDTAKQLHINDLYYDTVSGYSYKWLYANEEYKWVMETNSGIKAALDAASKAQDTADGKRRTFYNQPSPPYDKGDIWMQGENSDILICIVDKTINEKFSIGDWQKSCKYTDDTAADKAQGDVDNLRSDYESTKEKIDNKVWMEDLKNTSDNLQSDLSNLNSETTKKIDSIQTDLSNIKSDVSSIEKRVSTNEKDIVALKSDVSSMDSRLSSAERSLSNKATKDDVTTAKNSAIEACDAYSKSYTDGQVTSLRNRIIDLESALTALTEKVNKYHPDTPTVPDQTL